MSAHPLSGLVVAVVGATGELGSRLARGAAARGAHVVLVGRDEQRLHGIVEGASVVVGDVADTTLGHRVVAEAVGRYGGLDGLVNAAGVVAFGPLLDTGDEVIEELFLTNVLGPLFLLRRVVPALAQRRGFVVQLSAVVAETPLAMMAAYAASKAALTAADRALARELRRSGVDVIDVRPPHTETGLAGRPLSGTAPRLPRGLDPDVVAARVLDAIEAGTTELASTDFG
ncbi:MAG TPA: SDR family NAD(P)-dependent oxidoreductase [Ornithinibacter sp.]|nr:SDR family NAD(P)-dependent oxidoreductase [Ornithinibacter sp.]